MRILAAALLLLPTGCATLNAIGDGPFGVYSGTRLNVEPWGSDERNEHGSPGNPFLPLQRVVSVCDFPWSLALDTELLPVSLPVELLR